MPGDVFDHDDGVVDQDADREDQCEQADPVDGVAQQVGGEEGQQDRRRDDNRCHARLAPADGEADQDDDRQGGQAQVEQQLIGLFVGGSAVVPGDRHIQAVGKQRAPQRLDARQDLLRDDDGVRPLALGDREADRRSFAPAVVRARIAPGVGLVLARRLDDAGDIADIDGLAPGGGQRQKTDLGRAGQGLTGSDVNRLAAVAHLTRREGPVGLPNSVHQGAQRHAMLGEACRVRLHTDFLRTAAHDEGQPDIIDLGDLGPELAGEFEQGLVGPLACGAGPGRQRQHQARHVIDAPGLDQGFGDAGGNPVVVGADFLMNADCRRVRIGPDVEACGDHDLVVVGEGVDVFHARHALDDRLQRLADQFDRVRRPQPRGGDHDVDHRHADLRLFLPGNRHQGQQAHGDGGQQDERRQRRTDRDPGQPSGKTEVHQRAPAGLSTSPARSPASTSTVSASGPAVV